MHKAIKLSEDSINHYNRITSVYKILSGLFSRKYLMCKADKKQKNLIYKI